MPIVYHTGNSSLGMKNLLINSNGLINQRAYVSGTATTVANQYTVDRWRVVTSGQNLTFTTTNGVTTFTAPVGGVEQVIENLNILGGSYVLTVNGTATAEVSESTDNVTYTVLTPAEGIYTVTGGRYVKVKLSGGTFSLPQFERGTIATPYEFRPYGVELSSCQRYYEKASPSGGLLLAQNTTSISDVRWWFKAIKRIAPSITQTNSGFTLSALQPDTVSCRFASSNALDATARYLIDITASSEL